MNAETTLAEDPRLARLRERLQGLRAVLRLAESLTAAGEVVDLTGLDEQVGQLCAGTLDLPPALGRTLAAELRTLGTEAEGLESRLRAITAETG